MAPIVDAAVPGGRSGALAMTRPARDRTLVAVLIVAVGLTAFGLARHAMWFDELQAWNLARASRSIPDLLHHLRYEGHPPAWYLVLYGLTRVTGDPRAMQAAELVIVAATYAVVLFASPFSKPMRFALLAGYTLSFEYGVISRGYGLGVLTLVATLALLGRPRPRWKWALVTAVVLAWTSLAGAVVALALAAAVAGGAAGRGGRRPPNRGRDRRRFVVGTGVAAVAAAVVCVPPPDFHAFTPSVGGVSTLGAAGWTRLLTAATGTWRGLVPIPSRLGAWNSQVLDRLPAAPWVEAGLSIVVVVLMAGALRRFPTARRLWLLGSVGSFVFFAVVVLPDQARYAATTFLVFLGAAWWALAPREDPTTRRPAISYPGRRVRPGGCASSSPSWSRPKSSRCLPSTRRRPRVDSHPTRPSPPRCTPRDSRTMWCPDRTSTPPASPPTSIAPSTRSLGRRGSATSSTTTARPAGSARSRARRSSAPREASPGPPVTPPRSSPRTRCRVGSPGWRAWSPSTTSRSSAEPDAALAGCADPATRADPGAPGPSTTAR